MRAPVSSCPSPLHLGTAWPDQRRQFLKRKLASEHVPVCPGPSRCAMDYIRWPDRQTLSSPQGPSPSPSLSCRPSGSLTTSPSHLGASLAPHSAECAGQTPGLCLGGSWGTIPPGAFHFGPQWFPHRVPGSNLPDPSGYCKVQKDKHKMPG